MDLLLKLIPKTVEQWAVAAALVAAIAAVIKWLPAWVDTNLAASIDQIFGALGPYEDWLFLQFLIYLEMKYGPMANLDKAKAAVDYLISKLPMKYRLLAGDKVKAKLYELVTKIFETSKARIEKEAKEHGGIVPTLPAGAVAALPAGPDQAIRG